LIDLERISEKKILIIGDVGSGKTQLTAKIIESLLENKGKDNITIIDMAPSVIPKIGGKISLYTNVLKLKYLTSQNIRAPRTEGKDKENVSSLANLNKNLIEPLIETYLNNPTEILIINDLSLYLHAGSIEKIEKCMDLANTFIANAYYGKHFSDDRGSGINEREKNLIEELMKKFDEIIRMDSSKRQVHNDDK
jgi:GTPase SAR1 family protein